MSVTFQQLLDRAEEAATNIAIDASVSPLVDSEVTAEVIYPHAVRSVFRDYAKTGRHLDDMQMEHSITMSTTGVAALPDTVIREMLDHAFLPNDQFASKVPYEDYNRYRLDRQMCYFAIRGGNLYYSCADDLAARGTWRFISNPAEGETVAVNGVTFTGRLSGVVLASAGEATANGTYTRRGEFEGKPYYTLSTDADPALPLTSFLYDTQSIYWDGNLWIANDPAAGFYFSASDTDTPQEATGWTGVGSSAPAPSVTARTFSVTEFEVAVEKLDTADNFAATLNASVNASISVATYTSESDDTVKVPLVEGVYDTTGTAGNAFTMAASSAGAIAVSGATFSGGGAMVLNTPGIPTAPTAGSDVLTFAPAIIDDVVMKIASVLRGTTSLESLTGGNDVRK
jgi:hypothetical protein